MKKERNYFVGKIFLFCVFLFTFINVILAFLIFPVKQQSVSMNPDISAGSTIMCTKIGENYSRGDVVLIEQKAKPQLGRIEKLWDVFVRFFTGQKISLYESKLYPGTKQQLRRVICVPGDTFYMRDYVMYIKPAGETHFLTEFEISEKNYNVSFVMPPSGWDSTVGVTGVFDETVLGEGEYFVLSDLRLSSDDSRMYGKINKTQVCGKALFCYFPFDKIKLF